MDKVWVDLVIEKLKNYFDKLILLCNDIIEFKVECSWYLI